MKKRQQPLRLFFLSIALFSAFLYSTVSAKTLVLPHVLESSGSIGSATTTFDTDLFFTYNGLIDKGASVSVYIYDDSTDQALKSASGEDVCNPCVRSLGSGQRWQSLSIRQEMVRSGGIPTGQRMHKPFVLSSITGDTDNVAVTTQIRYRSPGDSLPSFVELSPPCPVKSNPGSTRKVFVLPHVLEKSGLVDREPNTLDMEIHGVYTGGLAGSAGSNALLDFYLYEETGIPMKSLSGDVVCNPCSYSWGTSPADLRKQSIRLDDLITSKGGFDIPVKTGFGILVVGGADPENVALQGFVVNSHTNAFDLSVFGFDPVPIASSARMNREVSVPGLARSFSGSPNPTSSGADFNLALGRDAQVSIGIYTLDGRKVATAFKGGLTRGAHTLSWKGMGDSGKVLAPGHYFARLEGEAGALVTRLVKVR